MCFAGEQVRRSFRFAAGQFNMVYLFWVGEVAISIVSDSDEPESPDHTLRVVGRATKATARLWPGDELDIRGPFGQGWPLDNAQGINVVIVTGEFGCAPVMGAIKFIFRRRNQ